MSIKWKNGSQFKCEAEVAHKEIEAIRMKKDGQIAPADVVAKAKPRRNPLHGEFEWDDAIAAQQHREERARCMLRSFVIVRQELKTDRPQRIYEVTYDKAESEPGQRPKKYYSTLEDIMKNPDRRAELLGRALNELVSLRNRYRDLQELAIVMRAIDETLETLKS